MEMLQGVWKQHRRPRAVVGYGVKIFLPSPPNYVTRSPGQIIGENQSECENNLGYYIIYDRKWFDPWSYMPRWNLIVRVKGVYEGLSVVTDVSTS